MENQFLEMQPTSIVALFQTNKEERISFASQVIQSVTEGQANPLNVHLQLKAMEDIIDTIKNDVGYKNSVLQYAEQSGKSFEYQNAKIDIREVGVKYDFSNCNDSLYLELESQQADLKDKVKQRAEFLKKAPIEGTKIVDDNGEVVTVYPPSKSSTTSIVVTLK
jgi:hypothetical protein